MFYFVQNLLLSLEEREGRDKGAGLVLRDGLRHGVRQFFGRPPTVFPQYLLDRRRIGKNSHVTAPYLEDTPVDIVGFLAAEIDYQGGNILEPFDDGQVLGAGFFALPALGAASSLACRYVPMPLQAIQDRLLLPL